MSQLCVLTALCLTYVYIVFQSPQHLHRTHSQRIQGGGGAGGGAGGVSGGGANDPGKYQTTASLGLSNGKLQSKRQNGLIHSEGGVRYVFKF